MLKLGHIIYSNCFPPHAGIVTGTIPFPFKLVQGIPTELNRLLLDGSIDVSPSSSIEFAVNPGRYLILPGLSITSRTEVRSIILQSRLPINELDRKMIALPTASATSIVLLRILLELREGILPVYTSFEQEADNPAGTADAMLFIGDVALKARPMQQYPYLYDLASLWYEFTGLPFVFAIWQINFKKSIDKEIALLYDILNRSKQYGLSELRALARAHADRFGIDAQTLIDYWNLFSYQLGKNEENGLLAFYKYAAEIGAIEPVRGLRFWEKT